VIRERACYAIDRSLKRALLECHPRQTKTVKEMKFPLQWLEL